MVFEPDDGSIDRDVDASMRMFQRSKVGPAALISSTVPSRILVALDGSPQDITSIAAAKYLRERFAVETLVLDARDSKLDADGSENSLSTDIANEVSGARGVAGGTGSSYEQILQCLSDHQLDLVIVPSPFGRSFESVGTDSVGTTLDVLLSRCPVPILVIRRDDQTLDQCIGRIAMVCGGESDVELKAASWIFGLGDVKTSVSLNLVVEKEQFENLRAIVEAIDPTEILTEQAIGDALAKSHQQIHIAMQRTAGEKNMSYQLIPQAGEVAPPNPLNDSVKQMLVMPLEVDDRFTQGFVRDRIRRSPHPVLVIPSHVEME